MKFQRTYTSDAGEVEIWYYDYSKQMNGPYKVEIQTPTYLQEAKTKKKKQK